MSCLRSMIGYLWALLALPIILATFIGGDFWAEKLVASTGLKVSPWFTGGEVRMTVNHEQYRTLIHQAVFDGLIRQRKQGFIQINWQPVTGTLPGEIDEIIDYDRDGVADFQIQLHTQKDQAELIAKKPYVLGIQPVYKLENERAVRVLLKNHNKAGK